MVTNIQNLIFRNLCKHTCISSEIRKMWLFNSLQNWIWTTSLSKKKSRIGVFSIVFLIWQYANYYNMYDTLDIQGDPLYLML